MSGAELAKLQALIDGGTVDAFYHWAAWEHLRDEVLRLDNYECQLCKARGKARRAVVVHHVQHVRERPDLALSVWDEAGERQLVSVCKECHEMLHPEALRRHAAGAERAAVTVERWD